MFHGALGRRRFPGTGTSDFILGFGSFIPPGGAVGGVAADPRLTSQTVVSGAGSPGRVMRTLDANPDAPAWGAVPGISLSGEPIVSLAFAPSAPGNAYAVSASGRVFRKDDVNDDVATPSWTAAGQWSSPTGSEVRQLAVNGQHDNRIYLVTAKEVVRSRTGGAGPWNSITGVGPGALPASDFHSIVAHADGRTLFVAADIGVSSSRGTTARRGTHSTRTSPTRSSVRSCGATATSTRSRTAGDCGGVARVSSHPTSRRRMYTLIRSLPARRLARIISR